MGEYFVQFDVAISVDNPDSPLLPPIVQKFVDLIHSSPDFRLGSATRTYSYTEPMTPTV